LSAEAFAQEDQNLLGFLFKQKDKYRFVEKRKPNRFEKPVRFV
jgi:hypothetical protein